MSDRAVEMHARRYERALSFVITLVVSGCASIAGVEDGHLVDQGSDAAAGTGGTGGTSGTGGAAGGGAQAGGGAPAGGGAGGGSAGAPTSCALGDQCVVVPAGWSGPVALILGTGAAPASCEGDFSNESALYNGKIQVSAAVCSCECDATAVSCTASDLKLFGAGNCSGTTCLDVSAPAKQCFAPPTTCTVGSASLSATASGTCSPTLAVDKPPVTWGESYRLCSPTQAPASCSGGSCVTPAGPPFESVECITAKGETNCPSTAYKKYTGYEAFTDSRDCSGQCSCGGAKCGSVTYFSDGACTKALISSGVPGFCIIFNASAPLAALDYDGQPSCAPSGTPAAVGNVDATGATTICCL